MVEIEKLKRIALRAGPSGRYLEYLDGRRYFVQADTAWELGHRCTREEVVHYLDTRRSQGFNAVLMVLLPELDVRDAEGVAKEGVFYPNRYNETPLVNDDPRTPNERYFEHIDWVVEQMIDRDIVPVLVPTWGRFINTAWNWGPIIFDKDNARVFGEYVGRLYPFCPKLLGGDINTDWINTGNSLRNANMKRTPKGLQPRAPGEAPEAGEVIPTLDDLEKNECKAVIEAMAQGIVSTEAQQWGSDKPMLTYHPSAFWMPWGERATASHMFGDSDWLALDGCQSGHCDGRKHYFVEDVGKWEAKSSWEPLSEMWQNGKRPIIDLESHYEGAPNGLISHASFKWNGDDIRTGAWQSILAGACGIVYGVNGIWQMWDPEQAKENPWQVTFCGHDPALGWKNDLFLPGAVNLHYIKDYFLSLPTHIWETRRPAQELLVSPQPKERDARIDIMMSDMSEWVLVHSGQGLPFELQVPFSGTSRWINPRSGKTGDGEKVQIGKVSFTPPSGSGGSVKEDWVLEISN